MSRKELKLELKLDYLWYQYFSQGGECGKLDRQDEDERGKTQTTADPPVGENRKEKTTEIEKRKKGPGK